MTPDHKPTPLPSAAFHDIPEGEMERCIRCEEIGDTYPGGYCDTCHHDMKG